MTVVKLLISPVIITNLSSGVAITLDVSTASAKAVLPRAAGLGDSSFKFFRFFKVKFFLAFCFS